VAIFQRQRSNPERSQPAMPRPLDPVSLQLFVSVCEERSIARAAKRESLVASALSKRIGALEAELGVALLVRRRGGIEPTPAGQALLARAREVLSTLERVRGEVGGFGSGVQGSVRMFAAPSALSGHLPDDIGAFLARHSAVRVSLDERYSPEIVRGVREGLVDLGVLWDLTDLSGLDIKTYRRDRLCVAMATSHPLAASRSLRFADTLDHVAICLGGGGQLDLLLRRQAALLGRVPNYRMQVSTAEAACRLVAANLGLAVVPSDSAEPLASAGRLSLVRLNEPWAERRFVVIARQAPLSSATARLLAEYLAARSARSETSARQR
jgi:DNA-binding transcriptional LysR family regulator